MLLVFLLSVYSMCDIFYPIQDVGRAKVPTASFSSVTSTNVEISPKNFLNFNFNPFYQLV